MSKTEITDNTRIIDVNAVKQHNLDLQRYGLYISRYRALPDYRDGLKPVQRRILYAIYHDLNAIHHTVKSAKIAGTVVGTYNPHGDTACYDAMRPMVNWFETQIPFLDKQGSFGTFQGDQAAAMRYTEARLNKFAADNMIGELQETNKVVNWSPTYTDSDIEPDFLPAKFPNLLVNGTFGIALGFKVYVPHHNLGEVIDATIDLIDHPDHSVKLIPDCSMPCEIIDTDWQAISNKGRGNFKVRGIIDVEQYKGHDALIVKSLPDYVFMNTVIDEIEDLISKKKLVQIHDMFDESNKDTLRYVILLKHGSDPNYVKEVLYKSTSLIKTFSVNFEALDGINPIRLGYKAYLSMFIMFRVQTKYRLYSNRMQALNTTMHEHELYIKVLESGEIDYIIDRIKHQKTINDPELIEFLIKKFHMTDIQAKFIINSRLSMLSLAHLKRYKDEATEMRAKVQSYKQFLMDDGLIMDEIKQELLQIKQLYAKPRRSKIIAGDNIVDIPAGVFKIVITKDNKIKKLQVNDQIMNRNTATPKGVIIADNRENILLADDMGKVFKLPVHKIPFTDRMSGGLDIRFLSKKLTSNINSILYEPELKERTTAVYKSFIVAITSHGYIKKLDIEDFITAPPSGMMFMRLEKGDKIKSIVVTDQSNDLVIYSNTHALRITLDDVPYLQKNAKGLIAMQSEDTIDGIELIPKTVNTDIIVLTHNGRVNRFNQLALPLSGRAKRGNKVIKLGEKDSIVGIYSANQDDILNILTAASGQINIPINTIPVGTSVSSGAKLLSTRSDAIITGAISRRGSAA